MGTIDRGGESSLYSSRIARLRRSQSICVSLSKLSYQRRAFLSKQTETKFTIQALSLSFPFEYARLLTVTMKSSASCALPPVKTMYSSVQMCMRENALKESTNKRLILRLAVGRHSQEVGRLRWWTNRSTGVFLLGDKTRTSIMMAVVSGEWSQNRLRTLYRFNGVPSPWTWH